MTTIKTELVNFLEKTNGIKGVSFVSVKGYENSKGEIANYKLNFGASFQNAQAKDLDDFKKLDIVKYWNDNVINKNVLTLELAKKAYVNVYNSLVPIDNKLYDGTIKIQSEQSKAQGNAYTRINKGLKVHNKYEKLYMFGLLVDKQIIVKGNYGEDRRKPLTKFQDLLKKDMRSKTFRMYIIEKADVMNLAKTSFNGEDLNINLS